MKIHWHQLISAATLLVIAAAALTMNPGGHLYARPYQPYHGPFGPHRVYLYDDEPRFILCEDKGKTAPITPRKKEDPEFPKAPLLGGDKEFMALKLLLIHAITGDEQDDHLEFRMGFSMFRLYFKADEVSVINMRDCTIISGKTDGSPPSCIRHVTNEGRLAILPGDNARKAELAYRTVIDALYMLALEKYGEQP